MIKVFEASAKSFKTNGLGTVMPVSCVEEKLLSLNGWKVDVTANINDRDKLIEGNIILVKTKEKGAQAFRIGNVTKTDRKLTFTAYHLYYDAANYILRDVRPTNKGPVEYIEYCNENTDAESPFTVGGDAMGTATHYFIRKTLLEAFQAAEEDFDCVFDIENYNVRIMKTESVGSDSGFSVVYGKNIQGVTIEESWDDVCTKILPVGSNGLTLDETYLESDIQYDIPYTKVVEFDTDTEDSDGNEISEEGQKEQLKTLAEEYLDEHKEPAISYTVKSDVPQTLCINDIISIKHPIVTIQARVQGYTYDTEAGRVKTLTFGNYDTRLSEIYKKSVEDHAAAAVQAETGKVEKTMNNNLSAWGKDMNNLSKIMSESFGLYQITGKASDGSTVYYMGDKPTLAESSVLWTLKAGALAVSKDGGKTWTAGISADGSIVAHYISTIGFKFDWATGGQLTLGGTENGDGLEQVYDADGNLIIAINNGGLRAYTPGETNANTSLDGNGVTTRRITASENIQMGNLKISPRKDGSTTFQKASASTETETAMLLMASYDDETAEQDGYGWKPYNNASLLEDLELEG